MGDDWATVQFDKTDFLRTIGLAPLYATMTAGGAAGAAAAG